MLTTAIGIVVVAYVALRCIDLLCASRDRFSGELAVTTAKIAASLVLIVAGFCLVDLLLAWAREARQLPGLAPAPTSMVEPGQRTQARELTPAEQEQIRRQVRERLEALEREQKPAER